MARIIVRSWLWNARRLWLGVVACLASACSPHEADRHDAGGAQRLEPGCDEPLATTFRAWEQSGFEGAVAIVEGGRARCLAGYGRANRETGALNDHETVFSIGSITKTFTAAAVLALDADGTLSLEDGVDRWVTAWPADKAHITLRDLLVHTSGLGGSHGQDHEPLTRDAALAAIATQELLFEPGSGYEYSNSGYTLLAAVVEEASGQPFRTFLSQRILTLPGARVLGGFWDGEPAPAGERAVGYLEDGAPGHRGREGGDHWAVEGNGGLALSVEELASWVLGVAAGEILTEPELSVFTTPAVDLGEGLGEAPGWVAVSADVLGSPALTCSGGGGSVGHEASLVWFPELDIVAAVTSNSPAVRAGDLLAAIAPALVTGDALPGPRVFAELPSEVLAPLVGRYSWTPDGFFAVEADEGGIVVSAEGSDAMRVLLPVPDAIGADGAAEHEQAVAAFLAGETAEGRAELLNLSMELGAVSEVAIEGTIFAEGELRTYATITFETARHLTWIALSELGSLSAIAVGAPWPSLRLGALGDELVFVPRGNPELTPAVELEFAADGSELIVLGAGAETIARRAPGP